MLSIVVWLAAYVIALRALGSAVRPWKRRASFKALFFPGTLLGVGLQRVAALLCIGAKTRCSPLADGESAFEFTEGKVPCLAGALFATVTHALLYLGFFVLILEASSAELVPIQPLYLPTPAPDELSHGQVHLDLGEYAAGVSSVLKQNSTTLLLLAGLSYVLIGAFATLGSLPKQGRWSLTAVTSLGGLAWMLEWLGVDFFPILSRGWWARWFYFSDCWAIFSLYVTILLFGLAVFGIGWLMATEESPDDGAESGVPA
ncbi:MAG: hypothetical protein AAF488_19445 [Planctomycetota bacterium]